jgi:hypothetical protein
MHDAATEIKDLWSVIAAGPDSVIEIRALSPAMSRTLLNG